MTDENEERTLEQTLPQGIFAEKNDAILQVFRNNTVWNGIMDVVYAENGRWHIVDYKTNADGSDLDTKYQGQLNAYVTAFKEITGHQADARTYHIDI